MQIKAAPPLSTDPNMAHRLIRRSDAEWLTNERSTDSISQRTINRLNNCTIRKQLVMVRDTLFDSSLFLFAKPHRECNASPRWIFLLNTRGNPLLTLFCVTTVDWNLPLVFTEKNIYRQNKEVHIETCYVMFW
jgi:hypothetical protein